MRKPSPISIRIAVGLAGFGVAYDSGLFGPTDGRDHSAVFSIPVGVTGTGSTFQPIYAVNNITGDEIVAPSRISRPQHQT